MLRLSGNGKEFGRESILLLGAGLHGPPWRPEKNIHVEEPSLGPRCQKLCAERAAIVGGQIVPEGDEEEGERCEAQGTGKQKEDKRQEQKGSS